MKLALVADHDRARMRTKRMFTYALYLKSHRVPGSVYWGAITSAERAKRRAAGKVAKASRKVNRP